MREMSSGGRNDEHGSALVSEDSELEVSRGVVVDTGICVAVV